MQLYIQRKTKKEVLSKNIYLMNNELKKAKGLCFTKERKDFAYIFPFNKKVKYSIHMIFVFYPIDIIFLDENNNILELKKYLKPFTFYFPRKKYMSFIELPQKTIKKKNLITGNKILMQDE